MSKVTVIAHPVTGQVITESTNKPGFGTFRVDTENTDMNTGFVNISRRSAFIRGRMEDLAKLNLSAGKQLPGTIIKKESFEPFYEGQTPKIYPESSDNAGESVLTDGKETYLEYSYSNVKDAQDVWVSSEDSVSASVATQDALAEQAAG